MSPWLSDRLLGSQSDERLIALAGAGSDRAFAAIVQRYRRPLLAFARRLSPSGDAEDLVQQTFLSALAALRSGAEVRHLRGWLHQILRHVAIRASRHIELPNEVDHGALSSAPSAQQSAELRMLALEALAAMAQLPTRQQQAMLATAVHGQSRAEVAAVLGVTEGAVRQLVHRARESLRAAVTAITPYPLMQALAAGPSGGGVADLVAGAGAGSAVLKIGALVVSGVVATGIAASATHTRAHATRGGRARHAIRASTAPSTTSQRLDATRLADARVRGSSTVSHGGGPGPSASSGSRDSSHGSDGGSGTGSDGSSGGPSPTSGSSDGGGSNSGSPGGPSVTTATSSDGGSGSGGALTTTTSGSDGRGGPGPSDGGQTMTTMTSGKDGGSSGGSGSGTTTNTTTTATTTDGH